MLLATGAGYVVGRKLGEHELRQAQDAAAQAQAQLATVEASLLQAQAQAVAAQAQAAAAKDGLSRSEHMLRVVCHELRTPLSVLSSYTQLLADPPPGGPATPSPEVLRRMGRSIHRMDRLVNDLVDLARIETGQLSLSIVPCELAGLCQRAADEIEIATGRQIETELPPHEVWTLADPGRLTQVLVNLLGNAVAYSLPDRPVVVTLHAPAPPAGAGAAIIDVKDEGPGISADDLPYLFEPGWRGPGLVAARATSQAGLGLGLYLCHELLARQDGRIWVDSQPGQGTTFHVSLPVTEKRAP